MTATPALPAMVDCPPMRSRMTEAGCTRMWRSAQEKPPQPHEARAACVTCPLGAQRSGVDAVQAVAEAHAAALAEAMRRLCPRCQRPATRLINSRWCISCYNRDREARIGRNAKGTPPQITALIRPEAVTVTPPAQEPHLVVVDRVTSRAEAVWVAARQAGPGVVIGVPPLRMAGAEPEAP